MEKMTGLHEKLIKLQHEAKSKCFNISCEDCKYEGVKFCEKHFLADFLIANGVIINQALHDEFEEDLSDGALD